MTERPKLSAKTGMAPGTLMFLGAQKASQVRLAIIDYDGERAERNDDATLEDCLAHRDTPSTTWINVYGLHDVQLVETLGRHYGLHSLLLEDIVSVNQRPKVERFDDCVFLTLKLLTLAGTPRRVVAEQLSIVVGNNFVLTFQEREGTYLDGVRQRIAEGRARIRTSGPAYLAYALMDAVVDGYFFLLEEIGDQIDDLEQALLDEPTTETLTSIHQQKRRLIHLRRSVWPLREVVNKLLRDEFPRFTKTSQGYVRDLYDHVVQIVDTLESYRELNAGLHDTYLTILSNRTNEVMRTLTLIATIFIPLTFVAGIYGMNFENMPELSWRWGYFSVWGMMAAITVVMLVHFKRKKWL